MKLCRNITRLKKGVAVTVSLHVHKIVDKGFILWWNARFSCSDHKYAHLMEGNMEYSKVYVEAVATFRENSFMLPREIIWEDSRHFEIDRVFFITPAASVKVDREGRPFCNLTPQTFKKH